MQDVKAVPGTLQEGGAPFHTTHWSVVLLAAQRQSLEEAQRALTDFCQAYWPPLNAFLRRRGCSQSDSQDLTQGFFTDLLTHDTLSRARLEKGKLRFCHASHHQSDRIPNGLPKHGRVPFYRSYPQTNRGSAADQTKETPWRE